MAPIWNKNSLCSGVEIWIMYRSRIGVAMDAVGNTYLVGRTSSSNFPTTIGTAAATVSAAFITKFDTSGTSPALIFSTYIQSPTPWWDTYFGQAIAVDHAGNIYIAGV